ncbi:winged helix-turn-helix domain-containing protein [Pseudomonas sp. H11T01]|uniref:winged helix-turn-helix domain-containing protein n=1 Tax=Pseudomonas sp. H11T01 TaxID=3402749 RepID=UPI003AD47791
MENGMTFTRKYFVVVTHSPASQLELETILSSERYNSFGTPQAKMFVEGMDSPFPPPTLTDVFSQHVSRVGLPTNMHDTQDILSAFESEWFSSQPASIPSDREEAKDGADDSTDLAAKAHAPIAETWRLSNSSNALIKDDVEIVLTGLEVTLVTKMLHHEERVVSKDDLIRSIGREPEHYRGLEMCLSRLQEKFKSASNGERLFRAVRNRGYCLIQKITRGKKLV